MKKNSHLRIIFWFAFVVFAIAAGRTGHYHFFGEGCFRPVLVTERRILDLGDVLPNALSETEFSITNGGWRSLQIKNVRAGCAGCVKILSFPKEPIRRNETTQVRIALDTKSLTGKVRKSIIITSNDPARPVYPMLIDAVVERIAESVETE